jgi:hypothetical protein
MSRPRSEGWVSITDEVRYLERVISDMEWEDQDPSTERVMLAHYKQCLERGQLWEPPF